LTDKEALTLIKAAMIMLNTYFDIIGSAELLELAAKKVGKETVEDLIFELSDAHLGSRKEIVECKAELVLSRMRNLRGIKEVN
tara:strand:- start:781 stop:1029 length:249 start_codon:yes stop_codon:yes gene_type:complete